MFCQPTQYSPKRISKALGLALLAMMVGACAKLEKEKEKRVVIEGPSGVSVGQTITLTATTLNASDSGYTWSSTDPGIASVNASGVVTGVSEGETTLEATGVDSGVAGMRAVVVTPELSALPFYTEWLTSGHADRTAEAFTHWNEDDPQEVPATCARCHSEGGFRDYLGDDGTAAGTVDGPAQVGSVIGCNTCHNNAAVVLDSVTFPSGVELTGLGPEARCMTCHQGRASTDSVDEEITAAGATDPDAVNGDLHFQNIHYYAAGATLNAGRVRGGYQYAGKVYDVRFRHVPGYDTCVGCHNPHSLEVRVNECMGCHTNVTNVEDLKDVRMLSSASSDYDGDGNLTEGIYYEMVGLRDKLLEAIQAYTQQQGIADICYDSMAYPYWFLDTNGNGTCNGDEAQYINQYNAWTARLLRATYNYQVASKDPGAFAHNAKYMIQLLYDSMEDLGTPVSLAQAVRNDPGHFNGASQAARRWDSNDTISVSCSSCHGGSEGYRFYIEYGVGLEVNEQANGLDCATCHDMFVAPAQLVTVDSVTFAGGEEVAFADNATNMCGNCHRGRETKATIDARIASGPLGFRNVHYLPAAAVAAGTDGQVGYEYDSKTYAVTWGTSTHTACTTCHDPVLSNHTFLAEDAFAAVGGCGSSCHSGVANVHEIRATARAGFDYDGDNNFTEPLRDELGDLAATLLAQMQAVANGGGTNLCYDENAYPYFFIDTNGDGTCDAAEAVRSNSFNAWTADLMKAAHNYQISVKDPGAWAHNFDYMAQLLIDSIEQLGGAVGTYDRP